MTRLRARLPLRIVVAVGTAAGLVAAIVVAKSIDGAAFRETVAAAGADPAGLGLATGAFAVAFALRARAWQLVLPQLPFGQALAAIHVSLGANHVLPFRLGEPARVLSVVRRTPIGVQAATASTVTLRASDMLTVVALGIIVAPAAFADLLGPVGWLAVAVIGVIGASTWRWLRTLVRRRVDIVMPGSAVVALAALAWPLEAVLVWQTARWAGIDASFSAALLVTTAAVAAQVAAFAPGGFGTYEAAAVAAWVVVGQDPGQALVAAVAAHGLKTVYSLLAGSVGLFVPAPSLVGRIRLPPRPTASRDRTATDIDPAPAGSAEAGPPAPIVLFMPAFNEQDSVARCVRRAPAQVCGHPVQVVVIDDGSTDRTVQEARSAGADVVELGANRGLGAAVRAGFQVAAERNAAAVAFCDADGEYPPEELATLVAPILRNEADYVGGSRFLGRIDHMRPHRRLGNIVLTRALSIVARRRITDGQTGYRAFSPDAVRHAEIIHDFNYAQVLTLDLLAKGYRYHEVPISYHFRTTGESYIRLGRYLRTVIPAVYREVNTA